MSFYELIVVFRKVVSIYFLDFCFFLVFGKVFFESFLFNLEM